MSKHFYKEMHWIKFCKTCGVEFRPERYSFQANIGLCWKHRQLWFKEQYQKYIAYEKERSQWPKIKAIRYEVWKKWVIKNIIKRREQALISYHRNKFKHKARKHRATKKSAN